MFNIEVGKPLPFHSCFLTDKIKRGFWRASFKCEKDYIRGVDASGRAILVRHPAEEGVNYDARLDFAIARNHAGPIIRKYNSYVFRQAITRTDTSPLATLIYNDVDLRGTKMDGFMRQATLDAQIDGVSYLLADTTNTTDGRTITMAQKRALGVRPFIRKINPDWVVNWTYNEGFLLEALITFTDASGNPFARYYNDEVFIDVGLKYATNSQTNQLIVASVSSPQPHGYSLIPLIVLKPNFDSESQISNIAELQKGIANYCSMVDEELRNHTFTVFVVSGVKLPDDEHDKQHAPSIIWGAKRMMFLKEDNAKIQAVGSDINQADSIRTTIREYEMALYRTAGLRSPEPLRTGPAESGIAKAFDINDLSVNLKTIADAAEVAENQIMSLVFDGEGAGVPLQTFYADDFNLPDFMSELQETQAVLSVGGIPEVIKKKQMREWVGANYALTPDEQKEFESELEDADLSPPAPVALQAPITTAPPIVSDQPKE